MRRAAWGALLLFAFVVPWDVSLNLGPPLGNSARLVGLAVLLAAIPAVLQAGCVRKPGWMQWLVLAFYLWWCCTGFWTVDSDATLVKLRAYFQDLMVVWLVWEFGEGPGDLRWLDEYEDCPRLYERRTFSVRADDGQRFDAVAYQMKSGHPFAPPDPEYLAIVRQGYLDWAFDPALLPGGEKRHATA